MQNNQETSRSLPERQTSKELLILAELNSGLQAQSLIQIPYQPLFIPQGLNENLLQPKPKQFSDTRYNDRFVEVIMKHFEILKARAFWPKPIWSSESKRPWLERPPMQEVSEPPWPWPPFGSACSDTSDGEDRLLITKANSPKTSIDQLNTPFTNDCPWPYFTTAEESIAESLENIKGRVVSVLFNSRNPGNQDDLPQLFTKMDVETLVNILYTEDKEVRNVFSEISSKAFGSNPTEPLTKTSDFFLAQQEKQLFLQSLIALKESRFKRKIRKYSKIRKIKRMVLDYLKTDFVRSNGLKHLSRQDNQRLKQESGISNSDLSDTPGFDHFVAQHSAVLKSQLTDLFATNVAKFIKIIQKRVQAKNMRLAECLKDSGEKVPWTLRQLLDSISLARNDLLKRKHKLTKQNLSNVLQKQDSAKHHPRG